MGWWRIDPETGAPAENAASALSRPPEFVLLNAVPGVDNDSESCYLGDGPLDMVSTLPGGLAAILGAPVAWPADHVRRLFLDGRIPPGVRPDQAARLKEAVEAFWLDIDFCYEDDWERPALPAERRWIAEDVVQRLGGR